MGSHITLSCWRSASKRRGNGKLHVGVEADDAGGAHGRQIGDDQPLVRREHDELVAGVLVSEIVLHGHEPLPGAAGPGADLG